MFVRSSSIGEGGLVAEHSPSTTYKVLGFVLSIAQKSTNKTKIATSKRIETTMASGFGQRKP